LICYVHYFQVSWVIKIYLGGLVQFRDLLVIEYMIKCHSKTSRLSWSHDQRCDLSNDIGQIRNDEESHSPKKVCPEQ
jgi:hypothetical protein